MEDLSGALCVSHDPNLFDPDMHHHVRLGALNSCWLCEEARDVCLGCPVIEACYAQAQRIKESYTIRAGMAWSAGRPRHLNKRRS